MKILMTGGTGLIGQALGQKLTERGHQLVVVSRDADKAKALLSYKAEIIECDLNKNQLDKTSFNGVDAIINLIGESIDGRWTEHKKQQILQSRTQSIRNLLAQCPRHIDTLVSASAQGYYGDGGDIMLDEDAPRGRGFLSDVCDAWEKALEQAPTKRKVVLRIGLVLTKRGGALKKLVQIFQNNAGAVLGSGEQWMSWISLHDLVEIFVNSVEDSRYSGVYNAANDSPVTNRGFTEVLSQVLGVMTLPAVPGFALRLTMGEMSDLVLTSTKLKPRNLLNKSFVFTDHDLVTFLTRELQVFRDGCSCYLAEQFIEYPIEKVFHFFSVAQNLEKITPDFLNFKIEKLSTPEIEEGTLINYKLKIHGVPAGWTTLIKHWNPPNEFFDIQLKGPYTVWEHRHSFKAVSGGTLMTDEVRYKVPVGMLGRLVAGGFVASDVAKIFDYRRRIVAQQNF